MTVPTMIMPPWKPPPGVRCPKVTMYTPKISNTGSRPRTSVRTMMVISAWRSICRRMTRRLGSCCISGDSGLAPPLDVAAHQGCHAGHGGEQDGCLANRVVGPPVEIDGSHDIGRGRLGNGLFVIKLGDLAQGLVGRSGFAESQQKRYGQKKERQEQEDALHSSLCLLRIVKQR